MRRLALVVLVSLLVLLVVLVSLLVLLVQFWYQKLSDTADQSKGYMHQYKLLEQVAGTRNLSVCHPYYYCCSCYYYTQHLLLFPSTLLHCWSDVSRDIQTKNPAAATLRGSLLLTWPNQVNSAGQVKPEVVTIGYKYHAAFLHCSFLFCFLAYFCRIILG